MSYILDALKKADAERALGVVPGLHARVLPVAPGHAEASAAERALRWGGATGLLVMSGVLLWQLIHAPGVAPDEPATPSVDVTGFKVPPEHSEPVLRASPDPSEAGSRRAAPPKASEASVPGLDLKLERSLDSLPPVREDRSDARGDARGDARNDGNDAKTDARARHRSDGSGIETLSQLPEHIRRELPVFSISGSIYTENPADRLLIVNGRIYHEGDELSPGLTFEHMLPKAAILRYKNYRYQLAL